MKERLDHLTDQILDLDPDDLKALLPVIQARMDDPLHDREWERSVISFFIVNAIRVKENLARKGSLPAFRHEEGARLRLVK